MSDLFSNLIEFLKNLIPKIKAVLLGIDPNTVLPILGTIAIVVAVAWFFTKFRDSLPPELIKSIGVMSLIGGTASVGYGYFLMKSIETSVQQIQAEPHTFFIYGTIAVVVGIALIFSEYERSLTTLSKSIIGNVLLICFGISLMLYPLAGYSEGIVTLLCINAIAAMGVSLLTGFTGIFSLGHAAYLALGAYAAAILTVRHGVHWLPAVLAGGVVAMIIAWAIGVPTLKLVGDYYTIASIGLGEAIRLILENWQSFTRGARGFPGIPTFTTRYVAVGFLIVMGLFMFNLINSRHGREFKAVRDDVIAASMMGFNTPQTRVFSLMISAFYCGVAGALLAGFMSFIQPAMFDMMKSTELTSIVVFGGLGSMSGTLIGTSIITLVTELFRPISQYRMLIYGLILVLIMVFRPEGILGNREAWEFFYRRKAAKK